MLPTYRRVLQARPSAWRFESVHVCPGCFTKLPVMYASQESERNLLGGTEVNHKKVSVSIVCVPNIIVGRYPRFSLSLCKHADKCSAVQCGAVQCSACCCRAPRGARGGGAVFLVCRRDGACSGRRRLRSFISSALMHVTTNKFILY